MLFSYINKATFDYRNDMELKWLKQIFKSLLKRLPIPLIWLKHATSRRGLFIGDRSNIQFTKFHFK